MPFRVLFCSFVSFCPQTHRNLTLSSRIMLRNLLSSTTIQVSITFRDRKAEWRTCPKVLFLFSRFTNATSSFRRQNIELCYPRDTIQDKTIPFFHGPLLLYIIIVNLQMGFEYAIKYLNEQVFVFLFLVHSRGIVVSDSLHQYHNPNKALKFDFRS